MITEDEKRMKPWREVAEAIFTSGCFQDERSGDKRASPYWINFRLEPEGHANKELIHQASLLILGMMMRRNIAPRTLIAGVPKAGTAFAQEIVRSSNGLLHLLPVSRELREFTVGKPEKEGCTFVVPIENVVNSGGSLVLTVDAIRKAEFKVDDAYVFVEREETARIRLQDIGVTLHSVFTIKDLLDIGVEIDSITPVFRDECLAFRSFRRR